MPKQYLKYKNTCQMDNDPDEDIQCKICNQIILKPALLPCKHQFCCFCIRSIRYKHPENLIVCPLCRKVCQSAPLHREREREVIKHILQRKDTLVFWGKGSAINDVDQNITGARGFYCILKSSGQFIGDIIWGSGSEHNSYVDEVGRGYGKAKLLEDGSLQLVDYKFRYSNSPNEEWSGIYRYFGNNEFNLQKGSYKWEGWGNRSSGQLIMHLLQILPGQTVDFD